MYDIQRLKRWSRAGCVGWIAVVACSLVPGGACVRAGTAETLRVQGPPPPPTDYRAKWAIIIGIDGYPGGDTGLDPLRYAANDAREFRQLLVEQFGYGDDRIFYLTDDPEEPAGIVDRAPTMAGIQHAFETWLPSRDVRPGDDARPGDSVLVFFAGHGLRAGLLAASDSDARKPKTCLSINDLRAWLEDPRVDCRHKLVILDCCFSGALFNEPLTTHPVPAATDDAMPKREAPVAGPLRGPPAPAGNVGEVSFYLLNDAFLGLTAGLGTQTIADGTARNRHSLLTTALLTAMRERVDSRRPHHLFTFTELAAAVRPRVAVAVLERDTLSNQIPMAGRLVPGQGDFIFRQAVDADTPSEVTRKVAAYHRHLANSRERAHDRPSLALLLGVEAYRALPEGHALRADAESHLRRLLAEIGGAALRSDKGVVIAVAGGPGGRMFLTGYYRGEVGVWRFLDGDGPPEVTWLAEGAEAGGSKDIVAFRFFDRGRRLLCVSHSSVTLRDVAPGGGLGAGMRLLEIPSYALYEGALDPSERWIAVPSSKGMVYLWDLHAGDIRGSVRELSHARGEKTVDFGNGGGAFQFPRRVPSSVGFSGDGRLLAIGDDEGEVDVWDLHGDEPQLRCTLAGFHGGSIQSVHFSPDAGRLVAAGGAGACCWELPESGTNDRPETLPGHLYQGDDVTRHDVVAVQSADRETLVTGGYGGRVLSWRWGRELQSREVASLGSAILALALSPDSEWAAAGDSDGNVSLIKLPGEAGEVAASAVFTLRGHEEPVDRLAFDGTGRWLISGSHDLSARVWDVARGVPTRAPLRLRDEDGKVTHVAFGGSGDGLVTVADRRRVTHWTMSKETGPGRPVDLGRVGADVESIAFGPRGRRLALGVEDAVHLWDVAGPDAARSVLPQPDAGGIDLLRFHPEGDALIGGNRFTHVGALWTLPAGGAPAKGRAFPWVAQEQRPPGSINETGTKFNILYQLIGDAAFSRPDGRYVAATDVFSNRLRLWDTTTTGGDSLAQPVRSDGLGSEGNSTGDGQIRMSPDGRWMVVHGVLSGRFFLYDLQRPEQAPLQQPIGDDGGTTVSEFAFSPTGEWLAAACSDDLVRLYPVDAFGAGAMSPDRVRALRGHLEGARAVAFSPDGRRLASLGGDGAAFLWDLGAADQVQPSPVLLRDAGWADELQFTPDGHFVAIHNMYGGGAIEFHHVRADRVIQQAMRVTGRTLTEEERATYGVSAQ